MALTLIHVGRTPTQQQFGLDQFVEHYKCDAPADVIMIDASVAQKGDAHPTYPFMFVTDRHVQETSDRASALDIVYTGCLQSSGGVPVLPPTQSDDSDAVQSASSSKGANGLPLASPLTMQYYAPQKELSFMTYGAEGVRGTVADPTDSVRPITITCGDTAFTPTGLLADIVTSYFTTLIVDTIKSTEIVATKFWHNVERKMKTLSPFLFTATAGNYIVLYSPGSGYHAGDNLTMTDGTHTALITVTQILYGGVFGYNVTSNTFNYDTRATGPIYATGGSGTGAGFYNIHVA